MDKENILDRIRTTLEKANRPVLFYDTDTDGTMSYFQLKTLNSNLKGIPCRKSEDEQIEALEYMGENHDIVLFFDIPYIHEEVMKKLCDKTIIWVDHHINTQEDMIQNYDIIYFNPLRFDEHDSRPSCFWAYHIVGKKENLPYVSVGSVADFYLLDCIVDFQKEFPKEFDDLFTLDRKTTEQLFSFITGYSYLEHNKERADWIRYLTYNTPLGVLKFFFDFVHKNHSRDTFYSHLAFMNRIQKLSLKELLAELYAQQNYPYDEFAKQRTQIKKLLKRLLSSNENKQFAYFMYEGEKGFSRELSEEGLYHLKNTQVLFIAFDKQSNNEISCSIRSNSIPIEPILKNSLQGLTGEGGGHELACGASISRKDFNEFKKRFFELLEKHNQDFS